MHSPFFPLSIVLACFIHGTIIILMIKLLPQIPENPEKSIPVLLVSADRKSAAPSQQTELQEPIETIKKLTTTGESKRKQVDSQQSNRKPQPKNPSKQTTSVPKLPTINQPNLTQTRRTNANTGIQDLFGQKVTKNSSQIEQLSSKKLPNLSDYELGLLRRLSRKDLYAEYHKVLEHHKRTQIDFSVEIVLFSNGAIKKAKINKSSKIPQIDELAIRTAYNASPYDKPPQEDLEQGYRYIIPISYQK